MATTTLTYGRLLASTAQLIGRHPVLRRRALYQATMFGAFSAFWTTVSYLLTGPPFSYSSTGVALFALVGAGGALIAPAAGRWADRGLARTLSAACFGAAAVAFGLIFTGGAIGAELGSVAYHLGGWSAVVATGGALPLLALVDWLARFNRR